MKNTEQLSAQRPSTLPHSPSTPCHKPARFLPLALLLAALAIPGSQAQATIRFWNGGGANNYWTTAANWGGTAPVAGDDLIFQANSAVDVTSLNNTNNFAAGTAFRSITFQVLSTNYVLNGNQVVFSDAAVTALSSQSSGQNAVNFDIQLNVNQTFEATLAYGPLVIDGAVNLNGHHLTNSVVNTSGNINIGGRISGTGDLVKTGNGTLLLDGAVNNTYSGTTRVTDGTLELNDVSAATEMVPGDVIISAGATLLLSEGNQIADNANITVNGTAGLISSSGRLNLNGYSDIISALTLSGGGDVATGAGTLTLGGNLTASAAYDLFSGNYNQASISGNLSLGSATRTLQCGKQHICQHRTEHFSEHQRLGHRRHHQDRYRHHGPGRSQHLPGPDDGEQRADLRRQRIAVREQHSGHGFERRQRDSRRRDCGQRVAHEQFR